MKKTIIAITASAFLASSLVVPTAASAWVPLVALGIALGIKSKDQGASGQPQAMAAKPVHHAKKKKM